MNRRAAFTLVEVLVVTAILTVLLVLAFPVMGRIRSAGHLTRCASNLKTIGTAVAAYEADNNGKFPPSRLQYTMDANGNKKTVSFLPDLFRLKGYLPLDDFSKLWWCPGDRERPVEMRKHSYGHNQRLGGEDANPTTWDNLPNPGYNPRYASLRNLAVPLSRVIYLIDFVDKGDAGKWSSVVTGSRWPMGKGSKKDNAPAGRVDFTRHQDRANALFLDGSVRGLTFEDLVGTEGYHIAPE